MTTPSFAIAIMAAGKGTRLKSRRPKVLHEIGGRALLLHVIAAAKTVVPADHIFCIIGHEADQVRAEIAPLGTQFVEQLDQRGTGHALMQCREAVAAYEKLVADNRRARHEYELLERVEAGLVLQGTEVKALREGRATIQRPGVATQ